MSFPFCKNLVPPRPARLTILSGAVVPFGRFHPLRKDLEKATKLEGEGGTGGAYKFWEWNEDQVKPYL